MYNGCNSCGSCGGNCGFGGNSLWIILIALVIVWVLGDGGICGCGGGCNGGCVRPCGGCDGVYPTSEGGCGCNR